MSILATVSKGRVAARPVRALLYGVEGVGKSTWAAAAPGPIFLDAERGTLGLDVARLPVVRWPDFLRAVEELRREKHAYKTLVLDTLDALDRLLVGQVCADAQVGSIEEVGGGYGKGWTQVEERWGRVLEELAALQTDRRMNVVALGHAQVETFRDPAGPDWQRWTLRMSKKSSAVWKGWTEELLFATREVQTARKDRGKGRGGERVIYTKWTPGRDCKNRRNLPERLPLEWGAFAAALRSNIDKPAEVKPDAEDTSMDDAVPQEVAAPPAPEPTPTPEAVTVEPEKASGPPPDVEADDLRDQIRAILEKVPPEKRAAIEKATQAAGDDLSRLKAGLAFCRQLVAAA